MIKVPDAYRSLYYIEGIRRELRDSSSVLLKSEFLKGDLEAVLQPFVRSLAREVDQILLPTIASEIHSAKQQGFLRGKTSRKRYRSFYIQLEEYTELAKLLPDRFPFLFEMVDNFIETTFSNLRDSISRFSKDKQLIDVKLNFSNALKIEKIDLLSSSDRHRSKQSLIFYFSNHSRVIYKPTTLATDLYFSEFVSFLELSSPYDLQCMEVVDRGKYGWIGFITHAPCKCLKEVEDYYRRFGVLLAVTDALFYTDGHWENLIASGPFPILLDGETFFQNYPKRLLKRKNVLSTMLIQKNNLKENFSALQCIGVERLEILYPYAKNDHTDEIEVRFRGIRKEESQNCPKLQGSVCKPEDYVEEIVEGYRYGNLQIEKAKKSILSNSVWWEKVESAQARSLIRETKAYLYLVRSIQQPELCSDQERARSFLKEKLFYSRYHLYEMQDILKLNIPYFYHYPGATDLYDGDGIRYANVLEMPAARAMKSQLQSILQREGFNISILRNQLRKTA